MVGGGSQEITQLLIAWSGGDQSALDRLIPRVHDELRRLACDDGRAATPTAGRRRRPMVAATTQAAVPCSPSNAKAVASS